MLRVAAINFLNPAPLMWDFEHPPLATELAQHYTLHYTQPSLCADELLTARADLASFPSPLSRPTLAIVPGCAIASLNEVRSIQLIVKSPSHPQHNKTPSPPTPPLAAPSPTPRSSSANSSTPTHLLPRHSRPHRHAAIKPTPPSSSATLRSSPLNPASHRRHHRLPCQWFDLAHEWRTRTNLPWVAAVWAVRPEALAQSGLTPAQLTEDLEASRNHGLLNIERLVEQWTPRIAIPPATIRHYLTSQHPLCPQHRLHPHHRSLPSIRRRGRHPPAAASSSLPLNSSICKILRLHPRSHVIIMYDASRGCALLSRNRPRPPPPG